MDPSELELARRKLAIETRLKRIDQELARKQIALAEKTPHGWRVLFTPTGAIVAAALLAFLGTAAAKVFDAIASRRQSETSIILKASDVSNATERANNLLWFLEAGYISLPNDFARQLREAAQLPKGKIPFAPTAGSVDDLFYPPVYDSPGTVTTVNDRKYKAFDGGDLAANELSLATEQPDPENVYATLVETTKRTWILVWWKPHPNSGVTYRYASVGWDKHNPSSLKLPNIDLDQVPIGLGGRGHELFVFLQAKRPVSR